MLTKNPAHIITVMVAIIAVCALLAHAWWFGAIFLAIAVFLAFGRKSQHTLLIGSSGGEKSALMSKSGHYIQSLVTVINDAVISRG